MKIIVLTSVVALASSLCANPTYEVIGGYFRLESERGVHYCKSGSFIVKDGYLVHEKSGLRLTPPIRVERASTRIHLSEDGFVATVLENQRTILGRLVVASFEKDTFHSSEVFQTNTAPRIGNPKGKGFEKVFVHARHSDSAILHFPSQAKILVREMSEVSTPSFTIGQIANIEASASLAASIREIEIGISPRVSADRALSKATIQGALRKANFSLDNVEIVLPERAIVRRESRLLHSEELEAFAKKWLSDQSIDPETLSLNNAVISRKVPVGDLEMRVRTYREANRSHVVTIEGVMNGESLFVTQLVFVSTSKTNTTASQIITLKSGDIVRVLVVSNGLTVETMGRVRRSAGVGETVVVTINDTKADLTGVVRSDGTVEVKL